MLLRSSSTSVLGSLLSSIESPNNRRFSNSNSPTPEHVSSSKISYNKHAGHPQNLATFLHNSSSPISPSVSEVSHVSGFRGAQSEGNNHSSSMSPSVSEMLSGTPHHVGGFRRVQSEGNLEGLGATSLNCIDDFNFSTPNKKLPRRSSHYSTLEAIPSFSFRDCSRDGNENIDDSEEEGEEEIDGKVTETENGTFGDSAVIENLCFDGERIKYAARGYENNSRFEKDGAMEMYLSIGLGISDFNFTDIGGHINGGGGGGGWGGYRPVGYGGGGGGDGRGVMMEEHYKKMLDENPGNPLCLRNYAQFLHHKKQDLRSAEEYYCRAILADPTDGDVLCQYAKLVWELYRDRGRARDYFERAVQAAGEDSHVQAAYACFLWEIADEDEDRPPSEGAKQRRFSRVKKRVTA